MEAQFEAIGLPVERFRALTPADVTAADLRPHTFDEARLHLTAPEIATSASHQRVWRRMIADGETHALVLEDDCELSPLLPAFLAAFERQGGFPGLVRIETRLHRQILSRRAVRTVLGIGLHRPFTWEWGAAAYIISADEARRVLASTGRFRMPIDDILLAPRSPLRVAENLLQANPALALVPEDDVAEGSQPPSVRRSDIQAERLLRFETEKPSTKVWKLAREFRRIRRQIAGIDESLRNHIHGRRTVVPLAREPFS